MQLSSSFQCFYTCGELQADDLSSSALESDSSVAPARSLLLGQGATTLGLAARVQETSGSLASVKKVVEAQDANIPA